MAWPNGQTRYCQLSIISTYVWYTESDYPLHLTRANLPDEMCSPTDSNRAQSDGGDIRFGSTNDCTLQYPCEVVSFEYDSTHGAGDADIEIHVRIPSISSSATTNFFVGYNTSGTTSKEADASTYGRNNVWSAGYMAVYHLAEDATGGTDSIIDSTGNGHHLTPGTYAPSNTAGFNGVANGALDFTYHATNIENLQRTSAGFSSTPSKFEVSSWLKYTENGNAVYVLTHAVSPNSTSGTVRGLLLYVDDQGTLERVFGYVKEEVSDGDSNKTLYLTTGIDTAPPGTWAYYRGHFEWGQGSTNNSCVSGTLAASNIYYDSSDFTNISAPDMSDAITIGTGWGSSAPALPYSGAVDEIRYRDVTSTGTYSNESGRTVHSQAYNQASSVTVGTPGAAVTDAILAAGNFTPPVPENLLSGKTVTLTLPPGKSWVTDL